MHLAARPIPGWAIRRWKRTKIINACIENRGRCSSTWRQSHDGPSWAPIASPGQGEETGRGEPRGVCTYAKTNFSAGAFSEAQPGQLEATAAAEVWRGDNTDDDPFIFDTSQSDWQATARMDPVTESPSSIRFQTAQDVTIVMTLVNDVLLNEINPTHDLTMGHGL